MATAPQDLVPYSFNTAVLPAPKQVQETPGQYQTIYFTTVSPDVLDLILSHIERWFEDRDEVILVDHGVSGSGLGFIVMEWEECTIDPLFISILKHDEMIDDYSIYIRDMEV